MSGDGITSAESMFDAYEQIKIKALELAAMHGVSGKPVYIWHRESLRFLDCLIMDYIVRGDSREEICVKIKRYWDYKFVKAARAYFTSYIRTNELDEEMTKFATLENAGKYYEYCLARIPDLRKRRIRFKAKSAAKRGFRLVDRLVNAI